MNAIYDESSIVLCYFVREGVVTSLLDTMRVLTFF